MTNTTQIQNTTEFDAPIARLPVKSVSYSFTELTIFLSEGELKQWYNYLPKHYWNIQNLVYEITIHGEIFRGTFGLFQRHMLIEPSITVNFYLER